MKNKNYTFTLERLETPLAGIRFNSVVKRHEIREVHGEEE